MNFVTVEEATLARLRDVAEPVELRDPDGKVLGLFTPLLSTAPPAHPQRLEDLFDLEEAERTLAAERDQGRPLKEVMRQLRSLENQGEIYRRVSTGR